MSASSNPDWHVVGGRNVTDRRTISNVKDTFHGSHLMPMQISLQGATSGNLYGSDQGPQDSSTSSSSVLGSDKLGLVVLHGALMVAAFLGVMPLAVLAVRHR